MELLKSLAETSFVLNLLSCSSPPFDLCENVVALFCRFLKHSGYRPVQLLLCCHPVLQVLTTTTFLLVYLLLLLLLLLSCLTGLEQYDIVVGVVVVVVILSYMF